VSHEVRNDEELELKRWLQELKFILLAVFVTDVAHPPILPSLVFLTIFNASCPLNYT
jgi:hypothetical protein